MPCLSRGLPSGRPVGSAVGYPARRSVSSVAAVGRMTAAPPERAGAEVSVVARDQTLAALRCQGLRPMMDGNSPQARSRAAADPAELGSQDCVTVETFRRGYTGGVYPVRNADESLWRYREGCPTALAGHHRL